MVKELELDRNNNILTVRLNRPEKRNALNANMISALMDIAKELEHDKDTDIVVLKGNGDSFCAGADLFWFKNVADLDEKERIEQLKILSVFLSTWHFLPQTTITVGHGNLYGGAIGLLAVSDFVILEQDSHLRLSEVLLGLIPASIAPFLIRKIGFKQSKALMLSAEVFTAQLALSYGLADKIAPDEKIIETENRLIENIQRSAPETRRLLKKYMFDIVCKPVDMELAQMSAIALSDSINSDIARENINAFYEDRK